MAGCQLIVLDFNASTTCTLKVPSTKDGWWQKGPITSVRDTSCDQVWKLRFVFFKVSSMYHDVSFMYLFYDL